MLCSPGSLGSVESEASEAAYRLARAEYVAEQGAAEAASILREVAMDELRHLVMVTRIHARDEVGRELPS